MRTRGDRSHCTPGNDDPIKSDSGLIPGLVVRANGFTLGTVQLAYGIATPPAGSEPLSTPTPDQKITFGGILELDDIRVGISGLDVRFDGSNPLAHFTGEIYVATGGAKLFPGKPFGATLLDRTTADDRRADGTQDDEAMRITLTFDQGEVQAFQMSVDTLEVRLGTYVTLTARGFMLDTGAAGTTNEMVAFQSVGAKVAIGSLLLSGEGRNFAFLGNGQFLAKQGFGVFLSVGSATGDLRSSGPAGCRCGSTPSASSGRQASRTTRRTSSSPSRPA